MKTLLPENSALIIVDMQNDFITGTLPVSEAEQIIPVLNRWIGHFYEDDLPVFYTRDWHPEDHCSFQGFGGTWPPHCVQHTTGAALHNKLRLVSTWDMNVLKGMDPEREQYSAMEGLCFNNITLAESLFDGDIEILYIGGVATEYCVKETVLEALGMTFKPVLILDGMKPVDVNNGFTALGVMVDAGATVV